MKILFITRKYPPSKGGMEKVAYELYHHLSEIEEVLLVKWGGSNKWLPLVLPNILARSFIILLMNKVDVIYLQDGLLSPLGVIFKIFRIPIVITIHGLDITYKNKLYQLIIPKCVRHLDKVICISQATKKECIKRAILNENIIVIPNGIKDEFYNIDESKEKLKNTLSKKININLENKKIILSVGRLVERKGIHCFIERVVPKIVEQRRNIVYLIVGDGIYRDKIKKIINENNLEDSVIMLGEVDYEMLKLLYNSSDIFVMPNIPVKGDMEGFGIVAMEATSSGIPVVASDLEGIKDAIRNGKNGILIEYGDLQGFISAIIKLLQEDNERKKFGEKAREYSLKNYEWEKIANNHLREFELLKNIEE